jgi:Ca2+-binding RTX toxin-like protein
MALFIGTSGNDVATAFNGTLVGFTGGTLAELTDGIGDTFNSGNGNDTVIGGSGNDTILGGGDNDRLSGDAGNDTVLGDLGDDTLFGGDGDDTVSGGAGNDVLDGGSDAGTDTLIGGANDDRYTVRTFTKFVVENAGEGRDTVVAFVSNYTLAGNVEVFQVVGNLFSGTGNTLDNVITGTGGAMTISGGDGNDTIVAGTGSTLFGNADNDTLTGASGNEFLDGGTGNDSLIGGSGNDTYVVDDLGDVVTELAGQGTDLVLSSISYGLGADLENLTLQGLGVIDGTGNGLVNTITGNDARNGLRGLEGNDTLVGNGGEDDLFGGAGADSMAGGTGSDLYDVDDVGDVVAELAGEGSFDSVRSSLATYTLTAHVEALRVDLAGATGIGNDLDNRILANALNVTLVGGLGNDTLTGSAGIDRLDGGAGADSMAGGAGRDVYVVDNTGDVVTEALNEGADEVRAFVSYTLTGNVEDMWLDGTANINGTGNALANAIFGNGGLNTLTGLDGDDNLNFQFDDAFADTAIGGIGNDNYFLFDVQDVIIELPGEGTDLVRTTFTYTLLANFENLSLGNESAMNGTGNAVANVILGNSFVNTLSGLDGNDTLDGQGGADTLLGGEGNDSLDGGAGIDTLIGGNGNDTFVVDNPADTVIEVAGGGSDFVRSVVSYTLSEEVENLGLRFEGGTINGTGNALANVILGNQFANTLFGLDGNDTLTASDGDDVSFGGNGNDFLDGGAGIDTMVGGAGDDQYVLDVVGDVVTEAANEGLDTVRPSFSYTLGANLEDIRFGVAGNFTGTGNELANGIYAASGANTIIGLGGDDYMNIGGADTFVDTAIGGVGNDSYELFEAIDVMIELANEGTDTVNTRINYTLLANFENLSLRNDSAINGTGNAVANVIRGNSFVNTLSGLDGDDTIDGFGGDDTVLGGNGNDTLIGGGGVDTLNGGTGVDTLDHRTDTGSGVAVNLTDGYAWDGGGAFDVVSELENILGTNNAWTNSALAGFSDFMTGSSADNTFSGFGGTDYIDGAGGNDVLIGGDGLDYLIGGAGVDNLQGEAGDDYLDGQDGNDDLFAGTNSVAGSYDYMFGRDGNDRNFLGTGAQYVIAGAGVDQVFVQATPVANEIDYFLDFTPGTDQILVPVALQASTTFFDQPGYSAVIIAAPGGGSYFMLVFGGTAAQVQANTFFV